MMYQSTRNGTVRVSAAQAIAQGISAEGGLFVPESFPVLNDADWKALLAADYIGRAELVLSKYLTDFSAEEIADCAKAAYAGGRFDAPAVAPLHELNDFVQVLELWHGPTCAFKDMALQMLPHLMRVSASKTADGKQIVILVATSGDTGKAALEGFRDAPNTKILVFYPEDGVSPMQKLQMVTQEGGNVGVCAIRGNFDDAQTGVKAMFTDAVIAGKLAENGMMFSSANSINWGRLVPQVVYYLSAYCDMVNGGKVALGKPINITVPTGNFGNILAAYYAMQMGLPVHKLICASNRNRVLTDFLRTGVYDRNRAFYTTTSPSMDILISSNLERLLFDLCGRDDKEICGLMKKLGNTGVYEVPTAVKKRLDGLFYGGCCDDADTAATIARVFDKQGYLCDTHTAVGIKVYHDYYAETGDITPTVIASTANPYKFSDSVLCALGVSTAELDEFDKVSALHDKTGVPVPSPLAGLREKTVRFRQSCDRGEMPEVVYGMLGITE